MAFLFKYQMHTISGIHVEPTNICTLKCCACARTRFIEQWPRHWRNHNLDTTDLLQFLDINLNNVLINFCGNYGDPIYHPDFIHMTTQIKKRGARISITTNGSYKKPDWWKELCQNLDHDDQIRFSIDGLPENFTQYRENADWQSIELGIRICASSSVRTIWKFIPFAFNQTDIEKARLLALELGMTEFLMDASDRFDEKTTHLVPVQSLIGSRLQAQNRFKKQLSVAVNPKCRNGREHFITATGHYSPCCFVADHRFYYKTQFGQNKQTYDIKTTRLSDLLKTPDVQDFYHQIDNEPPGVCQFNCPKS